MTKYLPALLIASAGLALDVALGCDGNLAAFFGLFAALAVALAGESK